MKIKKYTKEYFQAMGRIGGLKKSEIKRLSSQRNGKLGGRPRKTQGGN